MGFDPAAEGWKQFDRQGLSDLVGPFWSKRDGPRWRYGFLGEAKHGNRLGRIHGGMLMTFVDHTLGMMAWEAAERQPCVTLHLDTQFVGAVVPGDFVEMVGTVVRRTRSVIFMRGVLEVETREVACANGIWKRLEA